MKGKIWSVLVLAVAIQQAAFAQVPQLIHYQGRLLNGTNLVNGNIGIALRLYNQPAGGSPLYEDSNTVAVVDGLYSTFLGDNPVSNALLTAMTNPAVYVEVAVNGVALSPRERLSSVAYSLNTRGLSVDLANNVVLNPVGNAIGANAAGMTIGGGIGNLLAAGNLGVIAGGMSNRIGYEGIFESSFTPYSVIGGGRMNSSDARETVIGGGTGNQISEGFLADASRTVIGGGETNTAESSGASVIAGGVGNRLRSSAGSVIGGGVGNLVDEFSPAAAIGGGQYNQIGRFSDYTTIAGGIGNWLERDNDFGTISGGIGNRIGSNTQYAVIAGGQSNRIESGADFASIGGGNGAVASLYGQKAYSSGTHTNNSNSLAQSSEYILRGESVNGATNILFLDGVSKRLTIKPKHTLVFDITVAARNPNVSNAGYQLHAMAERSGSSIYVNGITSNPTEVPAVFEDVAAWKVQLRPNSANSSVDVEVVGSAGTTVRFVAVIRATEIQVP